MTAFITDCVCSMNAESLRPVAEGDKERLRQTRGCRVAVV